MKAKSGVIGNDNASADSLKKYTSYTAVQTFTTTINEFT